MSTACGVTASLLSTLTFNAFAIPPFLSINLAIYLSLS